MVIASVGGNENPGFGVCMYRDFARRTGKILHCVLSGSDRNVLPHACP